MLAVDKKLTLRKECSFTVIKTLAQKQYLDIVHGVFFSETF